MENYEELGYKYFYEISDREMQEICVAAQWGFLSDGTLFCGGEKNLGKNNLKKSENMI